jgi:hypothetical protein
VVMYFHNASFIPLSHASVPSFLIVPIGSLSPAVELVAIIATDSFHFPACSPLRLLLSLGNCQQIVRETLPIRFVAIEDARLRNTLKPPTTNLLDLRKQEGVYFIRNLGSPFDVWFPNQKVAPSQT